MYYTGGQDFSPTTIPNFVFQDELELCTSIVLEDDSIHESQEMFTISITTTDSAANLGTSVAPATINDNDGKPSDTYVMVLVYTYNHFSL